MDDEGVGVAELLTVGGVAELLTTSDDEDTAELLAANEENDTAELDMI
jgi:hypothetical protein